MEGLWIFLIFGLIRFLYSHVKKKKDASKVTVDELTKRFNHFTSHSELTTEYLRLLLLNGSNPEATRVIKQVYLAAKAKLHAKGAHGASRGRSKKDAKLWAIKEKNEKIFSNITTLEELKKKYRKLSKANHPDHGGNLTAMKRLNELYEEALKRISSSN